MTARQQMKGEHYAAKHARGQHNPTQPRNADVEAYLETLEHAGRREDAQTLLLMMREATGEEPHMWGPSIVGFGRYAYRYESDLGRLQNVDLDVLRELVVASVATMRARHGA